MGDEVPFSDDGGVVDPLPFTDTGLFDTVPLIFAFVEDPIAVGFPITIVRLEVAKLLIDDPDKVPKRVDDPGDKDDPNPLLEMELRNDPVLLPDTPDRVVKKGTPEFAVETMFEDAPLRLAEVGFVVREVVFGLIVVILNGTNIVGGTTVDVSTAKISNTSSEDYINRNSN